MKGAHARNRGHHATKVGIWEAGHTPAGCVGRYIRYMTAAPVVQTPLDPRRILEAAQALRMADAGPNSPAGLISVLCDDNVGGDELAARIEAQPVLCARVLHVANSPYYGQAKTVANVPRALLLLGVNALRGIAAAACVDQVMPQRIECLPDIPAILRHSLATAIGGEMLATMTHPLLARDAFLAGLLHNLGIGLQASLDPTGTTAIIAAREARPAEPIRGLEAEYSKFPHEECAAVLFEAWTLPDCFIESARNHHQPGAARPPHGVLASLVWAGANLALSCDNTYSLEPAAPETDYAWLSEMGLYERHIATVKAELPQRLALLSRAFR
jgi:HD-like signal output (HDOD) protein